MVLRRLLSVAGLLVFAGAAFALEPPWTQLGPFDDGAGAPVPAESLLVVPASSSLYAGTNTGVYRTDDGGAHWIKLGLASIGGVHRLAADPSQPATLYAATDLGLYKTVDAGATWTAAGLSDRSVRALVIDPISPATVYAGTSSLDGNGGIFKSADAGASWSPVETLSLDWPVSLAVDPNDPSNVFAGLNRGSLLRSQDAGASWAHVDPVGDGRAFGVIVDATATGFVYFSWDEGTGDEGAPHPGALRRSADGGATWADVPGLPRQNVGPMLVDPGSPAVRFVEAAGSLYRSNDGGSSWAVAGPAIGAAELAMFGNDPATIYAATPNGVFRRTVPPTSLCAADSTTLCLQQGRFRVEVDWQLTPLGPSFRAQAVPVTSESGYFWFFGPNNVELMVKVLDGTAVNGYYWVFYGALSSVQYTVSVTDTLSGQTKTYANPRGNLASVADAKAFPGNSASPAGGMAARRPSMAPLAAAAEVCQPDTETLCLNGGRFRVQAFFQLTPSGPSYIAKAAPLTADTGYFWFFDDANVELVVKVLDGTPVNGHYWVFYGALSTVQYTIVVTDTETGAVKTYENPRGNLASVADTSAF